MPPEATNDTNPRCATVSAENDARSAPSSAETRSAPQAIARREIAHGVKAVPRRHRELKTSTSEAPRKESGTTARQPGLGEREAPRAGASAFAWKRFAGSCTSA
jgi:hypothetical protein